MNLSSIGKVHKNRDLQNGKKIGILAIQTVAKTGNIGKKKKTPVADDIDYVTYLSMQKVNLN